MNWEWSNSKNIANFRKHSVWFEEAQTIWADEKSLEFFDPQHSEEDRYTATMNEKRAHEEGI